MGRSDPLVLQLNGYSSHRNVIIAVWNFHQVDYKCTKLRYSE